MNATFLKSLFLSSLIFSEVTNNEPSTTEVESSVSADIAQRLQKVNSCKDKVWPDLKLGQYPVYIADYGNRDSLGSVNEIDVVNGTSKAASTATTNEIKGKGYKPYYVDVKGGGASGVAVSVNRSRPGGGSSGGAGSTGPKPSPMCPQEEKKYSELMSQAGGAPVDSTTKAVDLVMHEAFHSVDQNSSHSCHKGNFSWNGNLIQFPRGVSGDAKKASNSVLYRSHMLSYLKKAIDQPLRKNEFLLEASRWYKKWESEYPEAVEELRTVDRSEGTASYVGSMASAIGKEGCDSASAVRRSFLQNANSKITSVPSAVDTQSYGLGAAAGLLLDEYGDTNWKKKVLQGKTPMQLLAEKFSAASGENLKPLPELENQQKIYDGYNGCLRTETLSDVEKAYAQPQDYVAIAVPIEAPIRHPAPGFSRNGIDWQLTSYSSDSFELKNWPQTRQENSSCGSGKYSVVLVPRSSVQGNSVESQSSRGSVKGAVSNQGGGAYGPFDLFCGM